MEPTHVDGCLLITPELCMAEGYSRVEGRLLHLQVPSTMFYWLAVEACRRALEPYSTEPEGGNPAKL